MSGEPSLRVEKRGGWLLCNQSASARDLLSNAFPLRLVHMPSRCQTFLDDEFPCLDRGMQRASFSGLGLAQHRFHGPVGLSELYRGLMVYTYAEDSTSLQIRMVGWISARGDQAGDSAN